LIILYMCNPVLMSRFCCILLIFWFDILHAIADLNKDSHCIAAHSEYFEVSIAVVLNLYKHTEHLRSFPSFCRALFLSNITESKMGY